MSSPAKHISIPTGEPCGLCGRNEQQCAATWPCCFDCHHWRGLDATGNPKRARSAPSSAERLKVAALSLLSDAPVTPEPVPAPAVAATTADLGPFLTDPLLRELLPHRLPRPDNSDGPTARLMALERQRALWAGEFNDNTTAIETLEAGRRG